MQQGDFGVFVVFDVTHKIGGDLQAFTTHGRWSRKHARKGTPKLSLSFEGLYHVNILHTAPVSVKACPDSTITAAAAAAAGRVSATVAQNRRLQAGPLLTAAAFRQSPQAETLLT